MMWNEVNFDGLVGPTHNYAGLSFGNKASASNKGGTANPREAALQGLGKARHMLRCGMKQAVLPPHDRPHLSTLRAMGFTGTDAEIVSSAGAANPMLLANVSSASCMWTANAATVTPAPDSSDGRTHFTPANLAAMFHRSIEWPTTARVLKSIFPEGDRFAHHDAVAGGVHMGDEGAANHNRFCSDYGAAGAALFVYGRSAFEASEDLNFPGRQTIESCHVVASTHGLQQGKVIMVRQSAKAINAGAFHNDVVAVSNRNAFFYHEHAFDDALALRAKIQTAMGDTVMHFIEVPASKVSLSDAISSYLFNSQLVSMPDREGMTLILPTEVENNPATHAYVAELIASGSIIKHADYLDLRQSMRNGGGPACLRLRVALSEADQNALGARVMMNENRIETLEAWVKKHYRDSLSVDDLKDPKLMEESFSALDELTQILDLGCVYDFQR